LLDTHTFLWFIGGAPQLSAEARRLIEGEANTRYLSIASAWEVAIKSGLGKLDLRMPLAAFGAQIPRNGVAMLPIAIEHLSAVSALPLHHRNPFDRLLSGCRSAAPIPSSIAIRSRTSGSASRHHCTPCGLMLV